MPEPLPSRYDHTSEDATYDLWEKSGYFGPEKCIEGRVADGNADPFAIVLPPPNVTGTLHMGHAEMLVLEDIMVRYHRMKGDRTLWIPGTDHAAIATQAKVEKLIEKAEGKSKHDLGREEFLKRVEQFARESHDTITTQVRKMGASVDWTREAFTLDEERSFAVRTAFKQMYDMGLIYRGARIVNWDPKLQTTVSDDEIEYVEQNDPFYHFKYGPFEIGTVRPETKFGDKYVVMHPADERYKQFSHGQKIDLEWINGPLTATVIKDEAADMEFGSGVMTITPAHSAIDFEIAQRHHLDIEPVIDDRGILLPIAGEFAGMHIKKARPLIVEKLNAKGLVPKVEAHYLHNVATNSRGGGIIEPQVKEQWFVAVNKPFTLPHSTIPGIASGSETTLKTIMRKAVESGAITILPERFEKVYFHWIDNLRDWCISRQIWYGHRVPVWHCLSCKQERVNPEIKERWFAIRHGETDWNKEKKAQGHIDIPLNETGRQQARGAAERLKAHRIDMILTSDLSRARETAEIIAATNGNPEIIVDARLRERNFGAAEGQDIFMDPAASFFNYESKEFDSESYKEMEERVWACIDENVKKYPGKNIAIVAHGGVVRVIMRRIENLPKGNMLAMTNGAAIANGEPFQFDIADPCAACGGRFFRQDPDTLDTWFSSGLWTFSTLGWPKETPDLKTYHPTSVLETGYDILFFWVARMILMTGALLGDIPFRTVYLHGLVRDAKGRKMSKSLDNIIDPLDLTSKYGADAARLSLIIGASQGNDIKLSEDRVRGYRNFSTKIWNVARFILMNRKGEFATMEPAYSDEDKKNLEELKAIVGDTTAKIESYDFHLAGENLYHYFWHAFADKIVEASKPRLMNASASAEATADKAAAYKTLETILMTSLALLHPFIPFVTEALYQKIRSENDPELLMIQKWPHA